MSCKGSKKSLKVESGKWQDSVFLRKKVVFFEYSSCALVYIRFFLYLCRR